MTDKLIGELSPVVKCVTYADDLLIIIKENNQIEFKQQDTHFFDRHKQLLLGDPSPDIEVFTAYRVRSGVLCLKQISYVKITWKS